MPLGNENRVFPLYICPKIIFELSTGDFLDGSFHSPFSFTVLRANDMIVIYTKFHEDILKIDNIIKLFPTVEEKEEKNYLSDEPSPRKNTC